MILNVSGRTDIVAFYMEWFMRRYYEGFVDVRNPFYPKQVSRIYFEDVEAIMFCTKNPLPILDYIEEIKKPILFHVTLTPYLGDIEPGVISKSQIIEAVKKLSSYIGKDYLYVRYDPIFLSDKYPVSYHIKMFERLCQQLDGYVCHIIVSFLDEYKNVLEHRKQLSYYHFREEDYQKIGQAFSQSAKKHGITVQTCFEERNLVEYGFMVGDCLGRELAFRLTGRDKFKLWKARGKGNCRCVEMVDIGVYNSCKHFCKYCYANYDEKQVKSNYQKHIPTSSLLIGELMEEDIIKVRK